MSRPSPFSVPLSPRECLCERLCFSRGHDRRRFGCQSRVSTRFSRASARSSLRIDVSAWKNLLPALVQTRRILTRQKQRRSHKHMSSLHVESRGESDTLKGEERDTGVRYNYFSPCAKTIRQNIICCDKK